MGEDHLRGVGLRVVMLAQEKLLRGSGASSLTIKDKQEQRRCGERMKMCGVSAVVKVIGQGPTQYVNMEIAKLAKFPSISSPLA